MKVLAPSHTIIAIGNYGYDWNGSDVDTLSFEDAVIARARFRLRCRFRRRQQ